LRIRHLAILLNLDGDVGNGLIVNFDRFKGLKLYTQAGVPQLSIVIFGNGKYPLVKFIDGKADSNVCRK